MESAVDTSFSCYRVTVFDRFSLFHATEAVNRGDRTGTASLRTGSGLSAGLRRSWAGFQGFVFRGQGQALGFARGEAAGVCAEVVGWSAF